MKKINMKDFKLLNIKSDCFDMIIASYTMWFKGEYRFLFFDSLGFSYSETSVRFGDRFFVDKGDIVEIAMQHDIKIILYDNLSEKNISEMLVEHSIVLELDEYNCYWRDNYKKIHRKHYVILMKQDEYFERYKCIDTFPNGYELLLSKVFITENAMGFFAISDDVSQYIRTKTDCCNSIHLLVEKFSQKNIYEQYIMFLNGIDDCVLAKELEGFENVNVIHVPLIWSLKSIVFSYYQFQYYLEYINDHRFLIIMDKLRFACRCWEIATNMITMSLIKGDFAFPKEKAKEYFGKGINTTIDIINQLSSLIK